MLSLRLNCDMAEGCSDDAAIMPLIDMANLSCGVHAGSLALTEASVRLAKAHHVSIGAHPSYPDRVHFGRKAMQLGYDEIVSTVTEQCQNVQKLCHKHHTTLSYVKPHGALYNTMMQDLKSFDAICESITHLEGNVKLMILSTPRNALFEKRAKSFGISLLYELFADRNYSSDGLLVPRSHPQALITQTDAVVQRLKLLLTHGYIEAVDGTQLRLQADTLCVHGDTPEALRQLKALRHLLEHK